MANFNFNQVILGGRLTGDVELRHTQNNVPVAQFTLAVNRKVRSGENTADFIPCVAWRGTAEFISKYFQKGSSICVSGEIQVRSWDDNNGNKRYATEVIVSEAYFVDGKNDSQQTNTASAVKNEPVFATDETDDFLEIGANDVLPF
jgi:single-strand DNA-binding protein